MILRRDHVAGGAFVVGGALVLAVSGDLPFGTLAFPGVHSRTVAMSVAGRKAATIMTGVVVMLGVAAVLEGVVRQMVTDTSLRYAIAIFAILLWAAFFYLPRGDETP